MSMREYGYDDYGVIISEEELKAAALKLFNNVTEESWNQNKYEIMFDVADHLGMTVCSNFSGSAIKIGKDGIEDYSDCEDYSDDVIVYMSLYNQPSLFKAAYNDMDEIRDEIYARLGKYTRTDDNYGPDVRHIVGSYYG